MSLITNGTIFPIPYVMNVVTLPTPDQIATDYILWKAYGTSLKLILRKNYEFFFDSCKHAENCYA